jgi:hypothetical protein
MKRLLLVVVAATTLTCGVARAERAQYLAYRQSQSLPWHNAYYHVMYGVPVALVVPPNAEYQSQYGWGVGGSRVTPIYHQFTRPYPGPGPFRDGPPVFLPPPHWPSDTTQFGVYYIRGPW